MLRLTTVILFALTVIPLQLQSVDAAEQRSTVFEAGTEGYKIYRIPAIIRAANGDLLAFCEARAGGDASEIDLVMKRSSDGGQTWGDLKVVQAREQFESLYPDVPVTVGNPAPVVDLLDPEHPGRIWLPFTVENDRVFVTHSDDHGETWSDPRDITESAKLPTWGWYATGPVHSIQLKWGAKKGRLLIPCDHRLGDDGEDRGPNGIHVVYSDDHGKTWKLGAIDDTYHDGLNSNETAAVELSNGRVYFNTRDQNGEARGTRGDGYSDDGGESFLPTQSVQYLYLRPSPPILDPPVVQCSLLRAASIRDDDPQNVILFAGPDEDGPSGKGRSDLRIRYTTDETKTWNDGLMLHEGPAAYSDMVMIAPEKEDVGVIFECGDSGNSAYQRIDFVRVPLSEVLND
ncbi:Sialidase precursor [Thalassoglobus neptunius]|uniref:exo-alpha-sialidase n=1 Tax=Thalassoglobus neptunius TaxID=1938619 RepID=A0A5C5X8S3_9PLAN|nr:sialidase family protein [Thalassoglobus neptunius]TWT59119.1 Sialidase precursor [Thalassoglobus neptunius]